MRPRYAAHVRELLAPGSSGLILIVEYDQSKVSPPPYSVNEAELRGLFEGARLDQIDDAAFDGAKFRVSSWWLVWFYVLCTVGELCLSPVGLSMVSKLAPRRFATMLMGIWLLTSFFGNFCAGLAGEPIVRMIFAESC